MTVLPGSAVPLYVGVLSLVVEPLAGVTTTGAAGATVSTVKLFVLDEGLVLPAASVAVALTVCGPSASGVVGVKLQLPLPSTVVVPTDVPSTMTLMVLPGSPVPLYVGVESLMSEPLAGVVTTGAAGATVSTVKVFVLETGLVLPAASVAVAFTVCGPSASGAVGVRVQLPLAFAVAVPTDVPSTMTLTVLPGSAVPLYVGVLSLVVDPLAGVATTGATGAVASTVKLFVLDEGLVLPAASVAVARTVCGPSASGVVGVKLQLPLAFAVAVPTDVPSTMMLTVLPGSAVPLYVGVLSLVIEPLAGVVTTGATGAVASTVKLFVLDEGLVLPATSVAVARTVCGPSASGVVGVKLQLPLAFAVAVPTDVPSTMMLTALPGSAVPLYVGVLSLVVEPLAGVVTTGAAGGVISTVKVLVLLELPYTT
ncbi:Pea-VEAacid family [Stigmatella aurantiaca DW4/3-1]|uniref:Pea-VEAacid family n=1 Tax=Stigmatella aurantiaca (strain DW4/3-1) TaxID=378806 RepID=Q098J8_STIAD|nr:Pea-VEAacid family [Stigmatella aurantiaca DW4/3-1]